MVDSVAAWRGPDLWPDGPGRADRACGGVDRGRVSGAPPGAIDNSERAERLNLSRPLGCRGRREQRVPCHAAVAERPSSLLRRMGTWSCRGGAILRRLLKGAVCYAPAKDVALLDSSLPPGCGPFPARKAPPAGGVSTDDDQESATLEPPTPCRHGPERRPSLLSRSGSTLHQFYDPPRHVRDLPSWGSRSRPDGVR
jgi:hypothetical protein